MADTATPESDLFIPEDWKEALGNKKLSDEDTMRVRIALSRGERPTASAAELKRLFPESDPDNDPGMQDLIKNQKYSRSKLRELLEQGQDRPHDLHEADEHSPGEVAQKNEAGEYDVDWRKNGNWTEEKKQKVTELLQEKFGLGPEQASKGVLAVFLTGRDVNEFINELNSLDEKKDDLRSVLRQYFQMWGVAYSTILVDHLHTMDEKNAFDEIPGSIEEMAWQIGHKFPQFSVKGEYPLLKLRTWEEDGKLYGKYYINETNLVYWVRDRMMYWDGQNPDDPQNFYDLVKVDKRLGTMNLVTILFDEATFFKSEEFLEKKGKEQPELAKHQTQYQALADQIRKEAWLLMVFRQFNLEYKQAMGNEEQLANKIKEMFYKNPLTKNSWGANMLYVTNTLPLEYTGPSSDSIIGTTYTEMFLAYYNLTDFVELQRVLGEDSIFFERKYWDEAMSEDEEYAKKESGRTLFYGLLGKDGEKNYAKAFGIKYDEKTGAIISQSEEVQDVGAFISFINIFSGRGATGRLEKIVPAMLIKTMAAKYGTKNKEGKFAFLNSDGAEDENSAKMAELLARTSVRFLGGAARGDTSWAGVDTQVKMQRLNRYREKLGDSRGSSFGRELSVYGLKSVLVDAVNGIRIEVPVEYDVVRPPTKEEKQKAKKEGKVLPKMIKEEKTIELTLLQGLYRIQQLRMRHIGRLKACEAELKKAKELGDKVKINAAQHKVDAEHLLFRNAAGILQFKENAMQHYSQDHFGNAANLMKEIMSRAELDIEGFFHTDWTHGTRFDGKKFQEEIQDKLIKPTRYLWETYPDLHFNQYGRFQVGIDEHKNPVYKTMPLGENVFGYQIVNIPEFWKQDEHGKYLIDKVTGRHVIDWNKVQDDKQLAYRRWVLFKLGVDARSHRMARNSVDKPLPWTAQLDMLKALESIVGELEGDEYEGVKSVRKKRSYFTKADLNWYKKFVGIGVKDKAYGLFVEGFLKSGFFSEFFQKFLSSLAPSGL